MSTGAIIAIIVVVLLVAAAAVFFLLPQMRSQRLRRQFGPEYDRAISRNDDRRAVERELAERERRHAQYNLKPIAPENRDRYRAQWMSVQERFVDAPADSVAEADRLVNVVVAELGYPSEGYERQLADLSVRHSHAVDEYRSAHHAWQNRESSTDDLRSALISYRKVFLELIENGATRHDTKRLAKNGAKADRKAIDKKASDKTDTKTDTKTDNQATNGTATGEPKAVGH